jgi:hypothetical protein
MSRFILRLAADKLAAYLNTGSVTPKIVEPK